MLLPNIDLEYSSKAFSLDKHVSLGLRGIELSPYRSMLIFVFAFHPLT